MPSDLVLRFHMEADSATNTADCRHRQGGAAHLLTAWMPPRAGWTGWASAPRNWMSAAGNPTADVGAVTPCNRQRRLGNRRCAGRYQRQPASGTCSRGASSPLCKAHGAPAAIGRLPQRRTRLCDGEKSEMEHAAVAGATTLRLPPADEPRGGAFGMDGHPRFVSGWGKQKRKATVNTGDETWQ